MIKSLLYHLNNTLKTNSFDLLIGLNTLHISDKGVPVLIQLIPVCLFAVNFIICIQPCLTFIGCTSVLPGTNMPSSGLKWVLLTLSSTLFFLLMLTPRQCKFHTQQIIRKTFTCDEPRIFIQPDLSTFRCISVVIQTSQAVLCSSKGK